MRDFQIDTTLSLSEGIKEIIFGRITSILTGVRDPEDPHTAIHETRRTLKRIRAILRLIRDEIGYSMYYRENLFYRDIARRMAPARDTFVLLQGVEMMEKDHPRLLSTPEFSSLKEGLSAKLNQDLYQFNNSGGGFKGIALELDQSKERVSRYCQLRDDFKSIRKGLRRIYSNGRGHLYRINERFNMEEFHEYRKNTKYLYYQMDLLQPVYPKLMKAYASTIDKHAELLGVVRDLDRLECYIQKQVRADLSTIGKGRFLAVIMEERKSLMDRIFSMAGLIYAERTKEFVDRINSYWIHHYG